MARSAAVHDNFWVRGVESDKIDSSITDSNADCPRHEGVSTSYAERNNGIICQHCKRYARLTLAFSKMIENHVYTFALHTMYHDFV